MSRNKRRHQHIQKGKVCAACGRQWPCLTAVTLERDAYRDGVDLVAVEAEAIQDEIEALDALFDREHTILVTAAQAWRLAHPGNELRLPALVTLIEWLMEGKEKAEPEPQE